MLFFFERARIIKKMEAQKKDIVEGIKKFIVPEGCVIARDMGDLDQCGSCNLHFQVRLSNEIRCRECNSFVCEVCVEGRTYPEIARDSFYVSLHWVYCSDTCRVKNVAKLKKQKTLLNRLK